MSNGIKDLYTDMFMNIDMGSEDNFTNNSTIKVHDNGAVSITYTINGETREETYTQTGNDVVVGNPEYFKYLKDPEMRDVMFESFPTIIKNLEGLALKAKEDVLKGLEEDKKAEEFLKELSS